LARCHPHHWEGVSLSSVAVVLAVAHRLSLSPVACRLSQPPFLSPSSPSHHWGTPALRSSNPCSHSPGFIEYSPGNPIVVDDDGNVVEVISDSEGEVIQVEPGHLREMTPAAGRLVLIEEVLADQEIWEDERHFQRDWVTEDVDPVPEYPELLDYIDPPQYLEPSLD